MTVIRVYCTFETVTHNPIVALVRTTDLIRLVTYSIIEKWLVTGHFALPYQNTYICGYNVQIHHPVYLSYEISVSLKKRVEHSNWRLCDIVSVIACCIMSWKWMAPAVIHFQLPSHLLEWSKYAG